MSAKQAIDKQSAEWQKCYHAKKWRELSELYTEDCKVYPPGREIAVGRKECAKAWESLGNMGVDKIVLKNVEVEYEEGSDLAADRSTFTMHDRHGKEIDHGEYVVIWRRVMDRFTKSASPVWQLHYDIFTSNVPAVKSPRTYILEQSAKWEHFYQIGDFNSLSMLYTPDCKVFPQGRIIAEGRIACERAWTRISESGVRYIKLVNEEVLEMGDGLATDYSSFKMFDARGRQIDNGKYVIIWKRLENGQWYLHFDIFNSDNN